MAHWTDFGDAFESGLAAYRRGQGTEFNPFEPHESARELWHEGWCSGWDADAVASPVQRGGRALPARPEFAQARLIHWRQP